MVKALCLKYENFAFVGSNPIADTKYIFIKMPFFAIYYIVQHGLMVKALCSRYENFALVGSNPIIDTKYIFS